MNTVFLFQEGGGSFIPSLILPLLIFAIFYFFVIRPQRQRQQETASMVSQLKNGDSVITSGGIIGKVVQTNDKSLVIRSADKTLLEIARSAVIAKDTEIQ